MVPAQRCPSAGPGREMDNREDNTERDGDNKHPVGTQ